MDLSVTIITPLYSAPLVLKLTSILYSSFKVPIPSKPINNYITKLDSCIFTLAIILYSHNYIYLIEKISNLNITAKHLNF